MVESSIVMTHITAAGVSVGLINWLKNSPYFPWITAERKRVLRAAAIVTSGFAAAGITYTWNAAAHTLTFQLPTLLGLWVFAVGWVKSFVTQEIVHQATSSNTSIAALLLEILKAVKPPNMANPGTLPVQLQK